MKGGRGQRRDPGPCSKRLASTLPPPAVSPTVHCYSFSKLDSAAEQLEEATDRVADELGWAPHQLEVRNMRSVAPGKYMLCYTFRLRRPPGGEL